MKGWIYYNGSTQNIYIPYTAGLFHKFTMNNGYGNNIEVGGVNTSGKFTATYQTSSGT